MSIKLKSQIKVTLGHSIFDQVLINERFFITVQKHFKKKLGKKAKKLQGYFYRLRCRLSV